MITMPQRWKDTILNPDVERKVIAQADINLGAAFIASTTSYASSDAQSHSRLSQLMDGVHTQDYAYIALDGTWTLGDGKKLASKQYGQVGYRGVALSDVNKYFVPYQYVEVNFLSAQSVSQVEVSFDPMRHEYAENFYLTFYNISGAHLATWSYHGNTEETLTVTAPETPAEAAVVGDWSLGYDYIGSAVTMSETVTGVIKARLTVTKWSHVGRTAKICEFFSSVVETVKESDRIISIDITEEADNITPVEIGCVTTSTMTLILDNSDERYTPTNPLSPFYGKNLKNLRISSKIGLDYNDGTNDMCPVGTHYTDTWITNERDATVKITASDILKVLDQYTYVPSVSITYPTTLNVIIDDVLFCSQLNVTRVYDDIFYTEIVPATPNWNQCSCREAMRMIAQAVNGRICQGRMGEIRAIAGIRATRTDPYTLFYYPHVASIGLNDYFSLDNSEQSVPGITYMQVFGGANNVFSGNSHYPDAERLQGRVQKTIQNNAILGSFTSKSTDDLMDRLAYFGVSRYRYDTKIKAMRYRCDPALEAGDTEQVTDLSGKKYNLMICKQTISYTGGMDASQDLRGVNV